MSMPTIIKVERVGYWPAEWVVETTKHKKIHVMFKDKHLTCRMGSANLGQKIMDLNLATRQGGISAMSTLEMLERTKFKMNLDNNLVRFEKEQKQNGPQPQTDTGAYSMSEVHVQ